MTRLDLRALEEDLRRNAFAPAEPSSARLGAEAEFIPVDAQTGERCPIEMNGSTATLPFLRRYGREQHWQESLTPKGTPCFLLPEGGTLTFEPGGQLEYSSPPCRSATALLSVLRKVVPPLRAAARREDILLLASGIDPLNSIDQAPLLVDAKRYVRMAEYLSRRGPAGARMMRQTAAFQISLDFGEEPWLRWRVLNAAAPYLAAIFANSPIYAGEDTGFQSARGAVWLEVDRLRTGMPYDGEAPVEAYLDFALAAPGILMPSVDGDAAPFGHWLAQTEAGMEDWHEHLTTLFPEVRPRGHLELRSIDALDPRWYPAAIALTAGLLYDLPSLRAANELLGTPDPRLLALSSRHGLHDPALLRPATDLFELGLAGCRRLGPSYFHPADLEQVSDFYERYTRSGRAPADDLLESAIAA